MRRTMMLAAVLAVVALGARADDGQARDLNRADVRCVLGMSAMAKNETYKQWGAFGIFYFSGRLEGRDPRLNLAEALRQEYPRMAPSEYNDEIKRCSDILGDKSRALEAIKQQAQRNR